MNHPKSLAERRDDFAMAAITGMLANPEMSDDPRVVGERAAEYADAALLALAASEPEVFDDADPFSVGEKL